MPTPKKSENLFTFVQLNFWGGRLYYPICRFLDRVQPDIFSGQEVLCGEKSSKPDHMTGNMLIDDDHVFFNEIALGGGYRKFTNAAKQNRQQHCATFTKKPYTILSQSLIPIQLTEIVDHWKNPIQPDYYQLLHTVVNMPCTKTPVHVLNFHNPVVIDGRMGTPASDNHFKQVAAYIKTLSGPIIFSGDCNLHKKSTSLVFLKNIGLKNLNDIYNISTGRNEFSWKPEEIVSHIFINDDILVHDYHVADDNVSDHKALVMKASIQN